MIKEIIKKKYLLVLFATVLYSSTLFKAPKADAFGEFWRSKNFPGFIQVIVYDINGDNVDDLLVLTRESFITAFDGSNLNNEIYNSSSASGTYTWGGANVNFATTVDIDGNGTKELIVTVNRSEPKIEFSKVYIYSSAHFDARKSFESQLMLISQNSNFFGNRILKEDKPIYADFNNDGKEDLVIIDTPKNGPDGLGGWIVEQSVRIFNMK